MPVIGFDWSAYCHRKLLERANLRESPARLFGDAINLFWNATGSPGELALRFASAGLRLIQSFKRDMGYTFSGTGSDWLNGDEGDGVLVINKAFSAGDGEELSKALGAVFTVLASALHAAAQAAPEGWSYKLSEAAPPETKNPLEIAIVSMPTREASTEIERDVANNITTTRQVEMDAQAAETAQAEQPTV